jgi:hypothetical protein
VAQFAEALLVIPRTLAVNAAQDATELVAQLRAHHHTSQVRLYIIVVNMMIGLRVRVRVIVVNMMIMILQFGSVLLIRTYFIPNL